MAALSGTIQEFGVADILQLIGQQAKTGCLALSNGDETVHVFFSDGAIIYAENIDALPERLLGSLLIRAELIDSKQLTQALGEQEKTLKRIGTILVELGMVNDRTVLEFAELQMMETLYGLFAWNSGTYQFESMTVDSPDGVAPIRADVVVMNGIRMVDEWPSLRAKIPSYDWMVNRVRAYPIRESQDAISIPPEERIYQLVTSGTTVQTIIDKSRLGEFETCRVLTELAEQSYIRIAKPRSDAPLTYSAWEQAIRLWGHVGRVLVSAGLVIVGVSLVAREIVMRHAPQELPLERQLLKWQAEAVQRRVLERALEVYRLRHGNYPEGLVGLVEDELVSEDDLHRPYIEPYGYVRSGRSYRLLGPVR